MPELPPTPAEEHEDMPSPPPGNESLDPELQQRAEQAERQRDEYFSLLRQAQADYENAHQRHRRERDQDLKFRAEQLARDLLPAIDNLDRALATAKDAGDSSPLSQGVAMVRDQVLEALKRHGIAPMTALGRPFDPHVHEAVMQLPDANKPPNTVIQILEQGYMIHDRVLRVAKVIISAPPTK
jgi:molecular chaperone GrpE